MGAGGGATRHAGGRLMLRPCAGGHNSDDERARAFQRFTLGGATAEVRASVEAAEAAKRSAAGGAAQRALCWRPTADATAIELGPCGRGQRWGRSADGRMVHMATGRCVVTAAGASDGSNELRLVPSTSDDCLRAGHLWRWACDIDHPPPPFASQTADERFVEPLSAKTAVIRAACSNQPL